MMNDYTLYSRYHKRIRAEPSIVRELQRICGERGLGRFALTSYILDKLSDNNNFKHVVTKR